ncbi:MULTISPECIES: universal stress protein [unclassified Roseovarius]|uniref:universal stress protein n=1 Tax=unclassified Roseovarius TaxID=2614913 RepID=UPI0027401D02|nr:MULTISPECIES: universal stress protein [unclassified Roseovarius]
MKHYAKKRCADPSAFYTSAEDILKDQNLSADEKEHVLKSLAVDVELLNASDVEETVKGEYPPDAEQITTALGRLRDEPNQIPGNVPGLDVEERRSGVFSRIVVALSGETKLDEKVVQFASAIRQMSGGITTFVSVVQPVTVSGGFGASIPISAATIDPTATETESDQREELIRDLIQSICGVSTQNQLEVRSGFVDEEIHAAALERNADLIIVGAHDRSWIEGLLTSKTSEQLAERTNRPILIVPE